jgi:hypothetical protein
LSTAFLLEPDLDLQLARLNDAASIRDSGAIWIDEVRRVCRRVRRWMRDLALGAFTTGREKDTHQRECAQATVLEGTVTTRGLP